MSRARLTAFQGVEKLPPATTLTFNANGSTTRKYWALDYSTKQEQAPPEELAAELRELIWDATRVRMISEVPLGAFLSGGIDSSAIVAAMASQSHGPVKTFSIGFTDAAFDELEYARQVADQFSTDHHEFVVEPRALDIMPKLARHYGEPFADPSAIPSFYLAEMTSRHVTVALNGDGGDESFAGYHRYLQNNLASRLDWLPRAMRAAGAAAVQPLGDGPTSTSLRSRLQRLARVAPLERHERYAHWLSAFPAAMRPDVIQPEILASIGDWHPESFLTDVWARSTAGSAVERMLDTDVNTYLPDDLLVKMDIATMAHSVEGRSPLLDQRLMEFAASLPPELKLDGTNKKMLLKRALRGLLPDAVLDRPKMGFGVPLIRWFREDLRTLPEQILLAPDARVGAYVKPDRIRRMIREHQAAAADHSLRLWVLLQLELWHHEVLEAPLIPPIASSSTVTSVN